MSKKPVRLAEYIFTANEFKRGKYINKGSFGYAYEIWDQRPAEPVLYAAKAPRHLHQCEPFLHEMEMVMRVKHPATIAIIGFLTEMELDKIEPDTPERSGPVIIMSYMPNKDLKQVMKDEFKNEPVENWNPTKKSINIFGIAAGMAAIHNAGICHGDLKEENIFLNENLEPVIADFGLAKLASRSDMITKFGGTPLYMAPEILNRGPFELPVDVYAYAITLYRLFESTLRIGHRIPRQGMFMASICAGQRFDYSPAIPEYIWNLITRCWHQDPAKRPTFMQIVNELYQNPEAWILEGADMAELKEYMERVIEGLYIEFDDFDALLATI